MLDLRSDFYFAFCYSGQEVLIFHIIYMLESPEISLLEG